MKPEYNKIILAGGTGQIGTALQTHFKCRTHELIVLTRSKTHSKGNILYLNWKDCFEPIYLERLNGTDVIINLAGKNVNCRYNEKNKAEIIDSRVNSIKQLSKIFQNCSMPPALWFQASSATIYRHSEDREMTESDGELGNGFSEKVCTIWEETFDKETIIFPEMRKVILRTSLVLSKNEGVYPRLEKMTRFGLGGKQGHGRQLVSWIHEADLIRIIDFIIHHPELTGVCNCTSPFPVSNSEFMKTLRNSLNCRLGLPAGKWLLELGAKLIGTETELILKSRWVYPKKLIDKGFEFDYPDIESCLQTFRM